ncbi:hypothetical protein HO133_001739 [Letharia lupina]|uniref:Uncharacterized protein n=1 Tax=Letharia lupina TaxID=560253 RepID=A0A8H6CEK1_9LECA|nr:uncharacterized protein HO133_001739 [Letharia lupina]KAF6221771.1 hypothetical protein HO133_001739 [Letharia lupina]
MPFSLRHADFRFDDGEELAPEWKSGNSWNLAKRRDVERQKQAQLDTQRISEPLRLLQLIVAAAATSPI